MSEKTTTQECVERIQEYMKKQGYLLLEPLNDEGKAYVICSSKLAALIFAPQETMDLETLCAVDKLAPIAMLIIDNKAEKREYLLVSAAEAATAGADKEMKSSMSQIPTEAPFITEGLFQDEDPREMKSHEKLMYCSGDTSAWFARGEASPTAEAWKSSKEGKTLVTRDQEMILYGALYYSSNGYVNGHPDPLLAPMLVIYPGVGQNGFHHEDADSSIEDSEGEGEGDGAGDDEGGAGLGNDDQNFLMIFETFPIGTMRLVDRRDKTTLPTMATFCAWIHECWANCDKDRVAAHVPDRGNLWPGYTVRVYEGGPNNTEYIMEQGLDEIEEGWEYSFFKEYVRRIEVQLLVHPNQDMLVEPNDN